MRAIEERHYLFHFNDGQEIECSSNILKVESLPATLPPGILLPAHNVIQDISAVVEAAGDPDVLDNEEMEYMPAIREKTCKGAINAPMYEHEHQQQNRECAFAFGLYRHTRG